MGHIEGSFHLQQWELSAKELSVKDCSIESCQSQTKVQANKKTKKKLFTQHLLEQKLQHALQEEGRLNREYNILKQTDLMIKPTK